MERPRFDQTWNPVENLPPREQEIERVTGVLPEEEIVIKENRREVLFANLEKWPGEIEKNPEERKSIEDAMQAVAAVTARYGGRPVPFPEQQVHLLDKERLPYGGNKKWNGQHYTTLQAIGLHLDYPEDRWSQTMVFHATAHELLHGSSFRSEMPNAKMTRLIPRHHGLQVTVEKKRAPGTWLDEAVTEELARRLTEEKKRTEQRYQREAEVTASAFAAMPRKGKTVEDIVYMETIWNGEDTDVKGVGYAYRKERTKLSALIDDLTEKNPDYLPDREAAFTMFARAYFTGNLLPLGRLLSETYKDKEALRRLMEGEDLVNPEVSEQA